MELLDATDALSALSHPGRLRVFRLLIRRVPEPVRAGELATALGLKPNTLSVYLATLSRAGLVLSERRGTALYYRPRIDRMSDLLDYLGADCCRGRADLTPLSHSTEISSPKGNKDMKAYGYNVLFICSGNSARSIFAEALLRDEGGERFNVFSAGTRPFSELNPIAVEVLRRQGHAVDGLRSKNTEEFQQPDSPVMDFVFTVCDQAANEECPPWPGQPITAHWGLVDPVKTEGTDAEKALAFAEAYRQMRNRVIAFVNLPIETLDRMSLQERLDEIGRADILEDH